MTPTKVAVTLLEDAKVYLHQVSVAAYCQTLPLLFNSSIGVHSRHFIEFFQCLLEQAQSKEGIIDYDKRKRNREIEGKPQAAIEAIDFLIEGLPKCKPNPNLKLQAAYQIEGDDMLTVQTCFDRELLYNIEHTIHHLAMIKVGLQLAMPNIELPLHFGIAPSTVRYRSKIQHSPN
ncbi:MAG: hypothetical protein ACPGVB_08075 [Chitinophagales bacterium]